MIHEGQHSYVWDLMVAISRLKRAYSHLRSLFLKGPSGLARKESQQDAVVHGGYHLPHWLSPWTKDGAGMGWHSFSSRRMRICAAAPSHRGLYNKGAGV